MSEPRPEWADDCCVVCPAQQLGPGRFDVAPRPLPHHAFESGQRVDTYTGVPVCVHPFRVGLPPGAYASAGEPVPGPPTETAEPVRRPPADGGWRLHVPREVFIPAPEHLELPDRAEDLEGWMVALLRTAPDAAMASALRQAETIAAERFPGGQVVAALRRVLATELRR
ncbi:hypothetical protein DPM19_12145 [Actinomadura craniellae]|uniref:Uncharacterized protein n=1 Tax=Actinomadura craniellae TaxID=2231787 RepID=A0A365H8K3_9ACTN|nr:hypothetical protein [Actinomadura craniellae]RAY15435.1 hypothetical protein DPM19_12145 [Actinomadura craniellae]